MKIVKFRINIIAGIFLFIFSFWAIEIRAQTVIGSMEESKIANPDSLTIKQDRALVGMLNNSLKSLADMDRRGRKTGGYVLLGLGIGSGLGGAATLAFGEGDDARIVGFSLLGGGALLSGLSLLPFRIKSETERIYGEFSRMPEDGPAQIHQKYIYWDRRFEELADKRRNGRIIGGITSIAAGVTGFIVMEGSDAERFQAFLWPAVGGVTALLVKSEVERRYSTYKKAKKDVIGQMTQRKIDFSIAPVSIGGFIGSLQIRF